jgi:hypothetical protein
MPLLQLCLHPGCTTWTIGPLCIAHEPVQEPQVFPRGRPFPPLAPFEPDQPSVQALLPQGVTAGSAAAP